MLKDSAPAGSLPRVSIGMPVWNGARWLEETLGTLRAQTLSDFELIISDNASTDETQAICARHAAEDRRIRHYRNERNIGVNRNHVGLVALARAEYFKWASSHDLCDRRFLECCVAALEAEPGAVLAYPNTLVFSESLEDARPYEEEVAASQESAAARFAHVLCNTRMNNAMHGVFRTRMLRRAHAMGSYWGADIVMMAELALFGKFVQVPEGLFFRRVSKESFTPMRSQSERAQFFEPDATSPLRWQNWKYLSSVLRNAMISAPFGPEKVSAVLFASKFTMWRRNRLGRDIVDAMRIGR